MQRIAKALLTGIVCAALLCGCSPLSMGSTGDLLRAPALGEQPGAIQRALTAAVGEVVYKYPKEGDVVSPLLLVDLNGDGTDEGVVLYSQGEGNTNVRLAVFEQSGTDWVLMAEAQGANTEVASIDAVDLYGNGTKLLVVGYANAALSNKTLEIYAYNGTGIDVMQHGAYNSYLLGDFTGRGGTDLAVVSRGEGDTALQLQIITGQNNTIAYLQQGIALQSNITTCVGIHASINEDGKLFLLVDGIMEANGALVTQVLVYSETTGQFYSRESDTAAAIYAISDTMRSLTQLTSRDIDGDGTVETPLIVSPTATATIEEGLNLYFIQWVDLTDESMPAKYFGVFDTETGLYIQLPGEWLDGISLHLTSTGWKARLLSSGYTVLEYRQLEEGAALPDNAWYVAGSVSTCLIPSKTLNAAQLYTITSVLLA